MDRGKAEIAKRKDVLVLRHVPYEHLGTIARALDSADIGYAYADLYADSTAGVAVDAYAGLILMGGPMSANDEVEYMRRETHLIDEFLAADRPVLGICLGAQLIAKAAGAKVYRNSVKEIGWAPVYWTEAGRQDALFAGLRQPEAVFHWHGETFDLPVGAECLAYSEACRHQAFRVGTAYGLQFHLEVTPAMIVDWLGQAANRADIAELTDPIDPDLRTGHLRTLSKSVFGRWCRLLNGTQREGAAR